MKHKKIYFSQLYIHVQSFYLHKQLIINILNFFIKKIQAFSFQNRVNQFSQCPFFVLAQCFFLLHLCTIKRKTDILNETTQVYVHGIINCCRVVVPIFFRKTGRLADFFQRDLKAV